MGHIKGTPSQFKGKKHSIESRRLMSIARLGNKNCVGRVLSEKTKKQISDSEKGKHVPKGKDSWSWKGNNIGVGMIHRRIEILLGKPKYCEHCKSTKEKCYDWAHKNHKYTLKISEWMRLCRSCHKKYDIKKIYG